MTASRPGGSIAPWEDQMARRRRSVKGTATILAGQLTFDFDEKPSSGSPARAPVAGLTTSDKIILRRAPARSTSPQFHPGCLGKRSPAPLPGEPPLNTKRAAHLLGKRMKWLETVRHRPNSPPWIKTGGGFEYFESQLNWWRELLNDGPGDAE